MSNDWLENIEVGQEVVIYGAGYKAAPYASKVARITKTQIITKSGLKFRRINGRQIASDAWNISYLHEATPELLEKVRHYEDRRKAILRLRKIEWSNMPLFLLQEVIAHIDSFDNEKEQQSE